MLLLYHYKEMNTHRPISPRLLKLLFYVFCLVVIIARRPDAITFPQFFAEDGYIWYADAYNLGFFKSLFIPGAGYLQIYPRLVAGVSLFFSMRTAPLIFNLAAVVVQFLPVFMLVSSRFKKYSTKARLFVVFSYLLLSNTAETYINLTNSQWYLAIVAYMVLVAEKTPKLRWKIFDYTVLVISGVSAPYAIILTPMLLFFKKFLKINIDRKKVWLVSATAVIQIISLILSVESSGRNNLLGVLSISDVYQIFHRQVLWGLLIGPSGYNWIVSKLPQLHPTFFFTTTVMGLIVVINGFLKASLKIKLFALFGMVSFAASVVSPTSNPPLPHSVWPNALIHSCGTRYWLLPMVSMLVLLTANMKKESQLVYKASVLFFLGSMVLFEVRYYRHFHNFQYPPHPDMHFEQQIEEFQTLDKDGKKIFQINPEGWTMTLTKK